MKFEATLDRDVANGIRVKCAGGTFTSEWFTFQKAWGNCGHPYVLKGENWEIGLSNEDAVKMLEDLLELTREEILEHKRIVGEMRVPT